MNGRAVGERSRDPVAPGPQPGPHNPGASDAEASGIGEDETAIGRPLGLHSPLGLDSEPQVLVLEMEERLRIVFATLFSERGSTLILFDNTDLGSKSAQRPPKTGVAGKLEIGAKRFDEGQSHIVPQERPVVEGRQTKMTAGGQRIEVGVDRIGDGEGIGGSGW